MHVFSTSTYAEHARGYMLYIYYNAYAAYVVHIFTTTYIEPCRFVQAMASMGTAKGPSYRLLPRHTQHCIVVRWGSFPIVAFLCRNSLHGMWPCFATVTHDRAPPTPRRFHTNVNAQHIARRPTRDIEYDRF